MPIHNLGYREWSGPLESPSSRWTVVAGIGIRRAWQSAWLRRVMFFAWIPAVAMGFMIFLHARAISDGGISARLVLSFADILLKTEDRMAIGESIRGLPTSGPEDQEKLIKGQHQFWSSLLLILFQRTQVFLLVPIIGLIAPPLISQDVRSRAFLLYFSRPLSKTQYVLGKAATILTYTTIVTLLPGLLLYTVGVLLSQDLSILNYTWDLPLRIVAVTATITVPSTLLALMFSSLTTESRYASFAWFSVWIFGAATHAAMLPFSTSETNVVIRSLSLYHLYRDVSGWLLDLNTTVTDIETRIIILLAITVISFAILMRRIAAPMKI
ncbi:MAG: hypothetical protein JNL58_21505 [Planctomyces sp.]|nr:hypothetical protein [Planctomyces sp.]